MIDRDWYGIIGINKDAYELIWIFRMLLYLCIHIVCSVFGYVLCEFCIEYSMLVSGSIKYGLIGINRD